MTITKEHLEKRLNEFTAQYKQANDEHNKLLILLRKLEGAIDSTKILIAELSEEKQPEKKTLVKK